MSNKNMGIKILGGALAITGLYMIYAYGKKKGWFGSEKQIDEEKKVAGSIEDKTQPKDVVIGNFPIAKGSKGSNVKLLQQALGGKQKLPNSYKRGIADGIFGQETENALLSQTGQIVVNSMSEIEQIASKNGLVRSITTSGFEYTPKSQQNILTKGNLPTFPLFK
jgi:peptidoglycan hydrolase-like protein with peptidoglycan-binding domain